MSGATVKYGTTEGTYDRDYCPYYVSAGTYAVYYKVSASGYVDYEGSVDVKIAKKPLTITAAAQNKDYDGTDDAVVDAALDTSGVVYYDEVALVSDGVAPTFDSKNSGTDKPVTLNGEYTLSGTAAQNYTLTQPTNLKANISKIELTIKNLEVADKFYDGLDTASFSATPQLSGVVGEEDVVLVNGTPSFDSVAVGNDIVINFTDFSLSGDDIGNYTLVQPVQGSVVASIKAYNATGEEYSVNSNDWLNEDFVVSAKEGWKLSYTNTAQGNGWVDSLSASEETSEGALQFYVKNTNTGVISEAITETYKIDKTAPDGRIYMIDETKTDEGNIDWDKVWETFVDPISFNIFLNNKQEVVLDGRDRTSGVAKWEYFISAQDLSKEELKDKTFTEYSDIFSIEPDDKFIIYARISDYAGNVTYIRSNGVVLDGTAPVISGADDGKTYCAAVTLTITDEYLDTVTLNGEPVALSESKLTLEPASGKQTVVATDKAGNSTTIAVTVNDGHTWGDWVSNGDGTHTRTCQFDATYTETADCHGGTATCSAKAVCEDCGAGYGEIDPSNHAGLKHVKAKAATTAAAGNTEYWYCSGCGKYFSDATATTEIQQADTVIAKLASEDNSKNTSKNVNTPQNGDDSLILLMLVLCLASGIVLTSSIIIRRKLRCNK